MASERPQSTLGAPAAAASEPPVTLPASAHLDPGAYVRGSNPITLGNKTLIHPRAHLLSTHAPLMVGDGCIVSEKAVVGGPLPTTTSTDSKGDAAKSSDDGELKKATVIENRVRIDPHAQIYHSAIILEGALIESHATILPAAVIGRHGKICAGVTIREGMKVPDYTVVWGNGEQRRRRHAEGDLAEEGRLKAFEKEREATIAILRSAAIKASQARREKGR